MKIGFFTDTYLPDLNGVSISVETCAKALEDRGHEVYIVAPRHPRYRDKKNTVYRLTSIKFSTTPEVRLALQVPERPLLRVLTTDFDVIHGHSGASALTFLGIQIARAKNIPHILTYHTLWNRYTHYFFHGKILTPKMAEVLSKFIANLSDDVIAPTERVKKELISYGVTKPIHILPSGIDLTRYKNVKKGFIREKIKVPQKTKILLSVGRLGREKSFDFLIHSFALIYKKNPNTVLVLVGDGPEKQSLQELVATLQIKNAVYFLGTVRHKDIPRIYADGDLFVFASQTETQGLVLFESLAAGLPVIAVNDEAFSQIIETGENGYLVKQDTTFFAEKTLDLLNNNVLYKQISQAALKSVEKFAIENTALYLEQLYEKAIRRRGKKDRDSIHTRSIKSFRAFFAKASDALKKYYE